LDQPRWAMMYLSAAAAGPTPDLDVQRAAELLDRVRAQTPPSD